MLSLATNKAYKASATRSTATAVRPCPVLPARPIWRRAAMGGADAQERPTTTVLDLIHKTQAWQRLNQIVEERQFARDDIMAFMSKGPMAEILDTLFCNPQTTAQMATDPALRATVEGAVRSFDSTLSEEDLLWLADLMGHVHHISESYDSGNGNPDGGSLPAVVEDALRQFGRAPSPGAAALLQAARNFWTPERVESFLEESRGKITDESAAAVRAMIGRLHAKSDVRTAALQTMDILELALPPAELWALAAANAEGAPPLDFHDFLEDDFVDRMREHIAPC